MGVTLVSLFLKEFPLGAVTIEFSKEFHGVTTVCKEGLPHVCVNCNLV